VKEMSDIEENPLKELLSNKLKPLIIIGLWDRRCDYELDNLDDYYGLIYNNSKLSIYFLEILFSVTQNLILQKKMFQEWFI
jgi:hypothetical protein